MFRRRQLRETGEAFPDSLLSGIERKTGWTMAEQAGLAGPGEVEREEGLAAFGLAADDADGLGAHSPSMSHCCRRGRSSSSTGLRVRVMKPVTA